MKKLFKFIFSFLLLIGAMSVVSCKSKDNSDNFNDSGDISQYDNDKKDIDGTISFPKI